MAQWSLTKEVLGVNHRKHKNIKRSFSSEPLGSGALKLIYSIASGL